MSAKEKTSQVFAIKVAGIRCVKCAGNIKNLLIEKVEDSSLRVEVSVMQENVYITTNLDETPDKVIDVLRNTEYQPVSQPLLISENKDNQRNIVILVDAKKRQSVVSMLNQTTGILKIKALDRVQKTKIHIEYNCGILKGTDLGRKIQNLDKGYLIINEKIQALTQPKSKIISQVSFNATIILWLYFLIVHMLFPILPFTKQFYEECVTFPKEFGIYTLAVLINIVITLYVMQFYSRGYIQRAYNNYITLGTTNMETLIALGSVSSFALSLFFIFKYTAFGYDHPHNAIMEVNDALSSASLIVLTVTIGKHFQKRVKERIESITEEIFPESVIFQNMNVTVLQMRNRLLTVLNQSQFDVSLVQKSDILRIKPGRVLLDLIIIQGEVRAIQSARTGSDEIVNLCKGDRLESGSVILEAENCLAEVQNVIQNSLLMKLATHIKFSQNMEENSQSGVQAICHKISNVFVKGVIILSFSTAVVWSILLWCNLVRVEGCKVCWVFERGISVLVASCPCALGLAVPSVIAIVLQLAIKSGILIRSNKVFQNIKTLKKIAFDKTGTLFNRIKDIQFSKVLSDTYKQEQLWQIIALLEKELRHPLAQLLYRQALQRSKINGTNYQFILMSKPNQHKDGISATIIRKTDKKQISVSIGNRIMFKQSLSTFPNSSTNELGATQLFLVINQQPCMSLLLNTHSNLRPETSQVIRKIQELGVQIHILSGDSEASVSKLGTELSIPQENLHWEKSSDAKEAWIKANQSIQQSVMMVGDGLNDVPCLQEAHIGVSINAKSQLNINAADVIILSENLEKIVALIRFLQRGQLFINLNLLWAFAYNLITMPIVAGVFYHWNIFVTPIWSSVAMSCSSLIVVSFSHLLSCFHFDDSLIQNDNQYTIIHEQSSKIADSTREVLKQNLNLSLRDQITT